MLLESLQFEVLIALPFDKFIRSRTDWSALGKRLGTNLLKMLLGDDGEKDHTFQEQGKGLSVIRWTVYVSMILTSLMARTLPYCGDFVAGSRTRSKLNFTSSALNGSPL